MTRSEHESRALFDRWANSYDAGLAGAEARGPLLGYQESLREAAALVPTAIGGALLDIGIGTGAFAGLLVPRVDQVFGVDPSPRMLARCREVHPDFRLAEGTFLAVPFAERRFDAVISSFAFHEVAPAERRRACAQLGVLVAPRGYLCLLDIMFVSDAAREEARGAIGPLWDEEEEYPVVGDVDGALRAEGFGQLIWRHTGPYHWAVLARRR